MKSVMFVTGRQGCGKTTLCRSKKYHVLPGQVLRKKFGDKFFTSCINPAAPRETEKEVREIITDAIQKTPEGEVLWVDGFPRNTTQSMWIHGLIVNGIHPHIVFLTCFDSVRRERGRVRDLSKPDAQELFDKREQTETQRLYDVVMEVHHYGLTWSILDNTPENKNLVEHPDPFSGVHLGTDLRTIFNNHIDLLKIGGTYEAMADAVTDPGMEAMDETIPGSPKATFIRNLINHIKMECNELLAKLPDKCWPIPDLAVKDGPLRVELVDAFHFMLSAAMVLGMDADFFAKLYEEKRKVNVKRQTEGYVKTRQGEDDTKLGYRNV